VQPANIPINIPVKPSKNTKINIPATKIENARDVFDIWAGLKEETLKNAAAPAQHEVSKGSLVISSLDLESFQELEQDVSPAKIEDSNEVKSEKE